MPSPSTDSPLWDVAHPEAPYDVVGLGEISIDTVARIDRWPRIGDKAPLSSWREQAGGQLATAVLGCARLGLRTALLGAVGRDDTGERALAAHVEAGIDIEGVRRVEGVRTRSAWVFVRNSDGERTILAHRDPALALARTGTEEARIRGARLLMIDTTDLDAARWAVAHARAVGVPVMLDADALFPSWSTLLEQIDFPVVSRQFADELGQSRDPRACLDVLCQHGARGAVVTQGEAGAIGRFGDEIVSVPAYPVSVRDTTGAGDAFHAGFAAGLLRGLPALACMRFACAVAALNCTGPGAQEGLPSVEAVEALQARDNPGEARRREETQG
jgi:sugar/nucleoside kinase (ribokinase family)